MGTPKLFPFLATAFMALGTTTIAGEVRQCEAKAVCFIQGECVDFNAFIEGQEFADTPHFLIIRTGSQAHPETLFFAFDSVVHESTRLRSGQGTGSGTYFSETQDLLIVLSGRSFRLIFPDTDFSIFGEQDDWSRALNETEETVASVWGECFRFGS